MKQQLRLLARAVKYRYKLDPAEIAYLLGTVRKGSAVLDLGAHKGAYTYWLRKAVGTTGRVVCVEPQENLAKRLQTLMQGSPNVEVIWAAISDTTGTGTLSLRADGSSHGASIVGFPDEDGGPKVEVPTTTMADLLTSQSMDRVDFIKCDVEGHELAVFEASAEVLRKHKPTILVECEERHAADDSTDEDPSQPGNVTRLAALVEPMGYRVRFFSGGKLKPRAEFDAKVHQNYGVGEYCNNWVLDVPA